MAYVIVYHKDQEVLRKPLDESATIGRSPDCELSVHDIMLSRRHCRIEPEGDGWAIADLASKNGTRVGGNAVVRTILADGDVIRMGKTAVRYRTGAFVTRSAPRASGIQRPADPFDALAGTVCDFIYQPPRIATNGIPFPMPRPSPKEPAAYADEDVRSLVSDLVSSSWDSIYEGASRPDPMVAHAHAAAERAIRRVRPREPRVDISLQAHPEPVEELALPSLPQASLGHAPVFPASTNRKTVAPGGVGLRIRRLAPIFQWLVVLPLVCLR